MIPAALPVSARRRGRRPADYVDALHTIAGSHVVIDCDTSTGSGTVVAQTPRNSYVVTCAHVIKGAGRCAVRYRVPEHKGLRQVSAQIEQMDTENDLALLRTARRILAPIDIADDEPEVYERLYAMGAPDGLFGTASDALLTSKDRYNGCDDAYQYTGLTVPGMSGGALCNLDGELVGVISNVKTDAHQSVWTIGFAVSLPKLRAFLSLGLGK